MLRVICFYDSVELEYEVLRILRKFIFIVLCNFSIIGFKEM